MTTTEPRTHRPGYPSRRPAEVVAVLFPDGRCEHVAAVAVQEAVARQMPVRFLQLVSRRLDEEARSLAEEAMFRAGLHALRGHPRTQSIFEVVVEDSVGTVGARCRRAALLVVGIDGETTSFSSFVVPPELVAVGCPVRTVGTSR